jgi:hypothetical protein
MPFRARHLIIVAALGIASGVAGCGSAAVMPLPGSTPAARPSVPVAPPQGVTPSQAGAPPQAVASPPVRITYPAHGNRKWVTAPAQAGGPDGRAGRLMTYRVQVERDIKGLAPAAFADAVRTTLAAPQGWTTGGKYRFRRAGPGQAIDFTLYLATPDTKDGLCAGSPDGYTSCRNGASVVLNVARWVKGIPHYGASLATYRQYMVNHEVGHRLGRGHELCPGKGELAPVMQQQTLGMHGCTPNTWPYPGGHAYDGRSGQYDDPVPPPDQGIR